MSCMLTIAIPIPDAVDQQGRYCAQVMRQAADYVEKQHATSKGQTIDPQRGVPNCTWECQDVEGPASARRRHG